MKKILILLVFILFFVGCDDSADGIFEPEESSFSILQIDSPDEFIYSSSDSVFTSRVFIKEKNVKSVEAAAFKVDGSYNLFNSTPMNLDQSNSNDQEKAYSIDITMGKEYPVGNYQIEYYIKTQDDRTKLAAIKNFNFSKSAANQPPVISNLQLNDTLVVNEIFIMSVDVDDPNGYNDIKGCFLNLYDENGDKMNSTPIVMYDDGNTSQNGDEAAADGTFTLQNYFTESAAGKNRTFEFYAVDNSNETSNVITKEIYVK